MQISTSYNNIVWMDLQMRLKLNRIDRIQVKLGTILVLLSKATCIIIEFEQHGGGDISLTCSNQDGVVL